MITFEGKGTVTIVNGEVNDTIVVKEGEVVLKGITMNINKRCLNVLGDAKVTVDKDCFLKTGDGVSDCTIFVGCNNHYPSADVVPSKITNATVDNKIATLVVEGVVENTAKGGHYAISGNGMDYVGTEIVINDGARIYSKDDSAIFHPQTGNLTINGGKVVGKTGITQKSGKVVVKGGTVEGNGPAVKWTYWGGGSNPTGDAVVVAFDKSLAGFESYPDYPKFIAKEGTLISANAEAVNAYLAKSFVKGSESYTFEDNNEAFNTYVEENVYVKNTVNATPAVNAAFIYEDDSELAE